MSKREETVRYRLVVILPGAHQPANTYTYTSRSEAVAAVAALNSRVHASWPDMLRGISKRPPMTPPRELYGIQIDREPEFNEWGEVSL